MKQFLNFQSLFCGLAMFSMFFGAGNIIFPLALGKYAGDQHLFATLGLILTAVFMPLAGVIGMVLFNGNYREFFGRIGNRAGLALAALMIALLGPLGSSPRCITLAYTTLNGLFIDISPILFSAGTCVLIFFLSLKKNHIVTILGTILTPILLTSLAAIIIAGFFVEPSAETTNFPKLDMIIHGVTEGYNTMDLLAAFFFSSTIVHLLKERFHQQEDACPTRAAICSGCIAAFLLSLVYFGFSHIASLQFDTLLVEKAELLREICLRVSGSYASILVCLAISLACLTTAVALLSAFAHFVQTELFLGKIRYEVVLAGSLLLTFFVSIFQFDGISAFLWPILNVCYPGLIVLTLLNIAYKWLGFQSVKFPVFATFAASLLFNVFRG